MITIYGHDPSGNPSDFMILSVWANSKDMDSLIREADRLLLKMYTKESMERYSEEKRIYIIKALVHMCFKISGYKAPEVYEEKVMIVGKPHDSGNWFLDSEIAE